jgi:serine/threonine protein kinase/formylglycine-generating enzyme required for sulfatase activity
MDEPRRRTHDEDAHSRGRSGQHTEPPRTAARAAGGGADQDQADTRVQGAAAAPSGHAAKPDVEDRLVGQTLMGQFRVLSRLGEGGMGAVYLAEQVGTSRQVVIKTLLPELVSSELERRFLREGRLLASLQHSSVVTVHNVGALQDGTLFIAMEYIQGVELADLMAEGPMAFERVLRIGEQIAKALVAAHAVGIVHRDLKPQNIMITESPGEDPDFAKVLDFGIAKPENEDGDVQMTGTGVVLGTPMFMSPEQAIGHNVGPQTDVYALGFILYLALTGSPAIAGKTPMDYMRAHVMDLPTPIGEHATARRLPSEFSALLMRCLSKSPDERPTAGELVDVFRSQRERVAHDEVEEGPRPAPVRAPEAAARDTRWRPRHLAYVVGALVLAFALAGLLLLLILGRGETTDALHAETPTLDASQGVEPIASVADAEEARRHRTDAVSMTRRDDARNAVKRAAPAMPAAPEQEILTWINIPAGSALYQGPQDVLRAEIDAFSMSLTEVTTEQYQRCVDAGSCDVGRLAGERGARKPGLPMVGVTQAMAAHFCRFVGGRLPTALEWIRAARGATDLPWAAYKSDGRVDLNSCCNLAASSDGYRGLAPAGQLEDVSRFSLRDMTGNVSEWVLGQDELEVLAPPSGDLIMGGSWKEGPEHARVDALVALPPNTWFGFVGFRCAR